MLLGTVPYIPEEVEINRTFLNAYKDMMKEEPRLEFLEINEKEMKIRPGSISYTEWGAVANAYHLYRESFGKGVNTLVRFSRQEKHLIPIVLTVYHNLMKAEGIKLVNYVLGFQSSRKSYKAFSIFYEGREQEVTVEFQIPISIKGEVGEWIESYLKKEIEAGQE